MPLPLLVAPAGLVGWFAGFVLAQLLDDLFGAAALVLVPLFIGGLVGLAVLVHDGDRHFMARTLGGGVTGALAVGVGLFALAEANLLGGGGLWLVLLLLTSMTLAAGFGATRLPGSRWRHESRDTP